MNVVELRSAPWVRTFGDWVFGAEPDPPRRRLPSIAGYLLLLLAGSLVVLLRVTGVARRLLWAEDGTVFISDAYTHSLWENLLAPYAGYSHVVPRFAAEVVTEALPVHLLGLGMNVCASLVWSAVALASFAFSRSYLKLPARSLLWLAVLLVPLGSHEVAGNVANSHWFLLYGLFWALLSRSPGIASITLASLLAAAAALSDPLALVFAPLAVMRLILLKGRQNVVSYVYVVAIVVQLLVVASTSRDSSDLSPSVFDLFGAYVVRVVWGTAVGPRLGDASYSEFGSTPLIVGGAGILAMVTIAVVIYRGRTALGIISLVGSVGFFSVVTFLTWESSLQPAPEYFVSWAGRYSIDAALLFSTAVVVIINEITARGMRPLWRPIAALILALALLIPGIANFRTPEYRETLLLLDIEIQNALTRCEATGESGSTEIPILPLGWHVEVPCSELVTDP